jgi:FtsH-binding integral membrane protein
MPDWKKLVRDRLATLNLPPSAKNEVIAELAAHLEEIYEQVHKTCATDAAAVERTLQEIDNWRVLARNIRRAKSEEESMNHRTKSLLWLSVAVIWLGASLWVMLLQPTDRPYQDLILFYLPWLATLPLVCAAVAYLAQRANPMDDGIKRLWLSVTVTWLGASLSFIVLDRTDHPSLILWRPIPIIFHLSWLTALILVGAAGAYLAQRADAPRKTRLLVATSPALLLGVVMLLLLPWRFARDGYPWALTFFAIDVENWAVVPGLALLFGALSSLRQRPTNSFLFAQE